MRRIVSEDRHKLKERTFEGKSSLGKWKERKELYSPSRQTQLRKSATSICKRHPSRPSVQALPAYSYTFRTLPSASPSSKAVPFPKVKHSPSASDSSSRLMFTSGRRRPLSPCPSRAHACRRPQATLASIRSSRRRRNACTWQRLGTSPRRRQTRPN